VCRERQIWNMSELAAAKTELMSAIREFSYRENHEEQFLLASGKRSPYYFDLKQTLLNPKYLALAGRAVAKIIAPLHSQTVLLAGLTMGADPIIYATCLSGSTQPAFMPAIVRKEAKDHGTGKRIEMLKGLDTATPCVMIDDVITTAGSTLKAVQVMRDAGFKVTHAVCVLDREEGGRANLKAEGIELIALFSASEFRIK
jgi:orotate phosphoribosyltransferase